MDIRPENARWYGLFLDEDMVGILDRTIDNQHVTFGYKVEVPQDVPWGAEYDIEVVGYGNDGNNEGYLVILPDEVHQWYQGAENEHITLSVASGASPVDTWSLDFEPVEDPFYVTARFGYVMNDNNVYFE